MLNHNYIGTEHMLLGLLHEGEGVAAQALNALGVDTDQVRDEVVHIIGRGEEAVPGHIPYTPRGKKILELSLREALQLGHNYIGTEHILLGLIREGEGVGAQVLVKLGAELTTTRAKVIKILSGDTSRPHVRPPAPEDAFQEIKDRLLSAEIDLGVFGKVIRAEDMWTIVCDVQHRVQTNTV